MSLDTAPAKTVAFKKVQYFRVIAGKRIVRLLPKTLLSYKRDTQGIHWVKGFYVVCPGEDCPVCAQNKVIIAEHPKDYKNFGYAGLTSRWAINVLDKTQVITCPKADCGEKVYKQVNNRFPTTCPKCNTVLGGLTASPDNTIYLWSFGQETLDLLNNIDDNSFSEDSNTQYTLKTIDLAIVGITGSDGKIKSSDPVMVENSFSDEPEIAEEDLIDSSRAFALLSADELSELMKGIKIGDIYKARRVEVAEKVEDISTATEDSDITVMFKE